MQPPLDPHDHDESRTGIGRGHIGLMVMWPDGSLSCGRDATDLLRSECGGLNPATLTKFRRNIALRFGIAPPRQGETNRRFLDRLARAGTIIIFDVDQHFPEFTDPPYDDAA